MAKPAPAPEPEVVVLPRAALGKRSLKSDTSIGSTPLATTRCDLCGISVAKANWEEHVKGKKHARAVSAKTQGKIKIAGHGPTNTGPWIARWCGYCSKAVEQREWETHVRGRSHKKKQAKAKIAKSVDENQEDLSLATEPKSVQSDSKYEETLALLKSAPVIQSVNTTEASRLNSLFQGLEAENAGLRAETRQLREEMGEIRKALQSVQHFLAVTDLERERGAHRDHPPPPPPDHFRLRQPPIQPVQPPEPSPASQHAQATVERIKSRLPWQKNHMNNAPQPVQSSPPQPVQSLQPPRPAGFIEKREWPHCRVCNLKVHPNDWPAHLQGKKHLEKEFKINRPNKAQRTAPFVSALSGLDEESEANGVRFCKTCDKNINVENWEEHMASKKHLLNLQHREPDPKEAERERIAKLPKGSGPYCGRIDERDGRLFFFALNQDVPPILMSNKEVAKATKNPDGIPLAEQLVSVRIEAWRSRYPEGSFKETVGKRGSRDAEEVALLRELEIRDQPFPPEALACVPETLEVSEEEISNREDFRDYVTFSIDPPGCTDIDDALHCRRLPNGNIEVGVHIADVSHYVKPGTALDRVAQERMTSVYMVSRRIDMLPPDLSSNLCSLHGGQTRLTFSCIGEFTPDGAELVGDTRFTRSVIRSRAAMSYAEAQERLDNSLPDDEMTAALKDLNLLFKQKRSRRNAQGQLSCDTPEPEYELDDDKNPIGLTSHKTLDANQLIEEFMLFANIEAAKKITTAFPKGALLRRHEPPQDTRILSLKQHLATRGLEMNTIEGSKGLASTIRGYEEHMLPDMLSAIRVRLAKSQRSAKYFCTAQDVPSRHFGLAEELYTHFTSPIRRYADIVVHRMLEADMSGNLDLEKNPEHRALNTNGIEIADQINLRAGNAAKAERGSDETYLNEYLASLRLPLKEGEHGPQLQGMEADGVIVDFPRMQNSYKCMICCLDASGYEGPVHRHDIWSVDRTNMIGTRRPEGEPDHPGDSFRVFDRVRVVLTPALPAEAGRRRPHYHLLHRLPEEEQDPALSSMVKVPVGGGAELETRAPVEVKPVVHKPPRVPSPLLDDELFGSIMGVLEQPAEQDNVNPERLKADESEEEIDESEEESDELEQPVEDRSDDEHDP